MKSTVTKLVVLLAALLLLTACTPAEPTETTTEPTTQATTAPTTEATTQPTTAPTTAPTTEATTAPTEPPYLGNFTQADVDTFTQLFKQNKGPVNYYNRLMFAVFDAPEYVNLNRMFYDQDTDEAGELTDAEKAFLAKQPQINLELSIVRVSKAKMDATLKAHLGIGLEDVTGVEMEDFAYFKDTDCYYNSKGDTGRMTFDILGGILLDDGTVKIYYERDISGPYTITLRQAGDGYLVVSNVPAFTCTNIPAETPEAAAQNAIESLKNTYAVLDVKVLSVEYDSELTETNRKMLAGGELVKAMGLTDAQLETHFKIINVIYEQTIDTEVPDRRMDSGKFEYRFDMVQDPETGLWSCFDSMIKPLN